MKPDNTTFKKECQNLHSRVKSLLRKNKVEEATLLIKDLEKRAIQWEEYDRSVRFKSRLIRTLFMDLTRAERVKRANLKNREAELNEPAKNKNVNNS